MSRINKPITLIKTKLRIYFVFEYYYIFNFAWSKKFISFYSEVSEKVKKYQSDNFKIH